MEANLIDTAIRHPYLRIRLAHALRISRVYLTGDWIRAFKCMLENLLLRKKVEETNFPIYIVTNS